MRNQKSPKSQKLLEFQTKLSKLSGKPPLPHSHQQHKLQQIIQHHKIIQADISDIFDQISEYYLKCEGKVTSVGKGIMEVVETWERSMLNMLAIAKEKEIDSIKEEIEGYMAYNKKVKKCVTDLEKSKNASDNSLIEQINKLKPFNNKCIHEKMQEAEDNRMVINYKIEQFEKTKQSIQEMFKQFNKHGQVGRSKNIKALMSEDEEDKDNAKNKDNDKGKLQQKSQDKEKQEDSLQNIYKNFVAQTKLQPNQKLNQHLYNSVEDSQRESIEVESRGQVYKNVLKNMFASQVDKAQEKQENLMEQTNQQGDFKRDVSNNLKFYKPDEEEELDEKTEKLIGPKPTEKSTKLQRHQSQPNIALSNSSQIQKSLNTFLQQLKRSRHEDRSHDISSRQQTSIAPKISLSKFSRVKSQQNLFFNYNYNYSKHQTTPELINMEEYSQTQGGRNCENIPKMGRSKLKESAVKTGRTNKGGWATILKAQQQKYNEMRKKIKN